MVESDNTVFVQLAADVGLKKVVDTADRLGITTPVEPYPSTAIGGLGAGVSPLDMAAAYSTFAGGHPPRALRDRAHRRRATARARRSYDHVSAGAGAHRGQAAVEPRSYVAWSKTAGPPRSTTWTRRPWSPLRRQDRHHGRLRGRMVRRLHTPPLHFRLGRLPRRPPIPGGCPRSRRAQRRDPAHGRLVRPTCLGRRRATSPSTFPTPTRASSTSHGGGLRGLLNQHARMLGDDLLVVLISGC